MEKSKYFNIDFSRCGHCIEEVRLLLKIAEREGKAKISFIESKGTHIEVSDE